MFSVLVYLTQIVVYLNSTGEFLLQLLDGCFRLQSRVANRYLRLSLVNYVVQILFGCLLGS